MNIFLYSACSFIGVWTDLRDRVSMFDVQIALLGNSEFPNCDYSDLKTFPEWHCCLATNRIYSLSCVNGFEVTVYLFDTFTKHMFFDCKHSAEQAFAPEPIHFIFQQEGI